MKLDVILEGRERGKPRKLKQTRTFELLSQIGKNVPAIEKIVDMHSTGRGTVAFVRTDDGDAYEIEVKPSYMGDYFHDKRGV